MLDGGLVLGPVTGAYYSLFQKEISNIPTVTPSLFNQTRRITRHNVSVTRYKSVTKNGHDWSPASTDLCARKLDLGPKTADFFLLCIFWAYAKAISEAVSFT